MFVKFLSSLASNDLGKLIKPLERVGLPRKYSAIMICRLELCSHRCTLGVKGTVSEEPQLQMNSRLATTF
jgi:hypothetical protein